MSDYKEYLEKQPDGTYALVLRGDLCKESDILIPDGAECLTRCKDHNGDEWLLFWKGDYKFCVGHDKEWFYFESGVSEYLNDWSGLAKVIWQRAMVKPLKEYLDKKPDGSYELIVSNGGCVDRDWIEIPEGAERARVYNGELRFFSGQYAKVDVGGDHFGAVVWQRDQDEPFLTPECTLNDQYAEIEQVRQAISKSWGSVGSASGGASQSSGGVDATLAERQSTYGCFEDVAFVTENIMSILAKVRVNGLDDLPNTHRMALYMIASKMARIVNGDFNHLDSWHDIGGYSKLIEKLIKGE